MPTLEKELWQSVVTSPEEVFSVLPTLEKELWQSSVWHVAALAIVLPTLEKELWQSRCVELYDNALSYVKFLSQD